jgi:hypothetical protein
LIDAEDGTRRERARCAYACLSSVERFFCGGLIMRQIERGPKIPKEVEKYGPDGCVKTCSARALQTYTLIIVLMAIGLAVAKLAPIAGGVFALACFVGALGLTRAASASKAGRRWRSHHKDNGDTTVDTRF